MRSYGTLVLRVQRLAAFALVTLFCAASAWAVEGPVKIVVLGDSLSAGYGLPAEAAFPEKLAQALKAKGISVAISNAAVSGDTASGGLGRLACGMVQ